MIRIRQLDMIEDESHAILAEMPVAFFYDISHLMDRHLVEDKVDIINDLPVGV